MPQVT